MDWIDSIKSLAEPVLRMATVCACLTAQAEWLSIPTERVTLDGVFGERISMTVTNNLLKVDLPRDFIAPFAVKDGKEEFVGTGNMIEAMVYLAKHTGNEELLVRKRMLVDAICGAQEKEGYIGCFPPGKRTWTPWDLEDVGFIIDGLVADWSLFGETNSLAAARRAADHAIEHCRNPPPGWDDVIYDKELLMGFGRALVSLYGATGDRRYLDFCAYARGYLDSDEPVVTGRDRGLRGHASGHLDTCQTQLEMYRHLRDPRLFRQTRKALDHLLNGNGALITGEIGLCECWNSDQEGTGCVGETCATVFAMFVYDLAIRLGIADPVRLGDIMERTVYNALFAAQSRDGRRLRYYTPLLGKRGYWKTDFYCCACNFRRAVSRLPEYVFYKGERSILANLYSAGTVRFAVDGVNVCLKEETDYPTTGNIRFGFEVSKPVFFEFLCRIPGWCADPVLSVNGEKRACRSGTLATMARVWRTGDRVELILPMPIRAVRGRGRQSGRFAVMRGPLVYGLNPRSIFARAREKAMTDYPETVVEAADLFVVDPAKMCLSTRPDSSAREGGTAIETFVAYRSWDLGINPATAVKVVLTEFPDPGNEAVYFRAPSSSDVLTVEDGLFSTPKEGWKQK